MRIDPSQLAQESQWARQARQGDEQAFARLVEVFQVPVYNLCFRMLGEAGEAEDAAQEAFLKAYRGLHRYDPERRFGSWCLSVTAHECIDRLRRRRMAALDLDAIEGEAALTDVAPGPESVVMRREQAARVAQLLDRLSPLDRAIITLKYWYDMPLEEIAADLDLTTSAVKSRLHRSRRELAQLYVEASSPTTIRGETSDVPLPV
ncbi:MAG: sigma-70 family RNA polymerase sigma factor [Anaerolineales bacterium]|nr:sigma-70 family RNA polymerase sigma factor [Anaerolineales bacterium]